jgi:hypothetical protein
VIDLRRRSLSPGRVRRLEGLVSLLPLMLGSLLIASLSMAAGPEPVNWLFQSPISPVGPVPAGSPSAAEGTVTGPALVAVPASPNFIPWLVGILVVGAVVGAAMMWRRGSEEGGGDE